MPLNDTPLTKMGLKTPKAEIYKSESHKLCHAFPVKVNNGVVETILTGSPVNLNSDGTVSPCTGTPYDDYIGIAVTDSPTPAYGAQRNYPVEVTVMMDGYAIVTAIASSPISAGPVLLMQSANQRVVEDAQSETDDKFMALNSADTGETVFVLVK